MEKMSWVRKAEICKAMGGRKFNGEDGRRKADKENKCNNTELERYGGRISKGGSRERRRKICPINLGKAKVFRNTLHSFSSVWGVTKVN